MPAKAIFYIEIAFFVCMEGDVLSVVPPAQ